MFDKLSMVVQQAPRLDTQVAYTLETTSSAKEMLETGFLSLHPARSKEVPIEDGWDADRATFVIDCFKQFGKLRSNTIRVYGYTDPLINGCLTDTTRLYFNRVIAYTTSKCISRDGEIDVSNIRYDDHVLVRPTGAMPFSTRPQDLVRRIGSEHVFSSHLSGIDHGVTRNMTSSIQRLRLAAVVDEDAVKYMAKVKDAARSIAPDDFYNESDVETYVHLEDRLMGNVIDIEPFFEHLRRGTNYIDAGYILFSELKASFDNIELSLNQVTTPTIVASGWDNSIEAWLANTIINRVSGEMGRCGIQKASTKGDPNDMVVWDTEVFATLSPDVYPDDEDSPAPFSGMGQLPKPYDNADIEVDVSIDLSTAAIVTISLDGQPPKRFIRAMYASARCTGLVVEGFEAMDRMCADLRDYLRQSE
jgi:hypothetical protein